MATRFRPCRSHLHSSVCSFVYFAFKMCSIRIFLCLLLCTLVHCKDEPSVAESDNSLIDTYMNIPIDIHKAHCGCPPATDHATATSIFNQDHQQCIYPVGTQVKYFCNKGYKSVFGSEILECTIKDTQAVWDNDPIKCEIINCGDPGSVPFATRKVSSFTYNSTIMYTCDRGYRSDVMPFMRCDHDGKWNRKKPTCKPIQCPQIHESDPNVFIQYSNNDRWVGSTVRFQCSKGYHLDNEQNAQRTCDWHGDWTGQNPKCIQKFCKRPPAETIPSGIVLLPKTDKFLVGESIHYLCKSNNEIEQIECQADGTLRGKYPVCPPPFTSHCPDIKLDYGQITSSSTDRFAVGAKITFECDYDFRLTEPKWIVCQNNGEWTNKPPRCLPSNTQTSLLLSILLFISLLVILCVLIRCFLFAYRWHQKQSQRQKYRKYFLNYEHHQDAVYMPSNENKRMRLFFYPKRITVPTTVL